MAELDGGVAGEGQGGDGGCRCAVGAEFDGGGVKWWRRAVD